MNINAFISSVPQQNCGPYSIYWQIESNSSNATHDDSLRNYVNNSPNNTNLVIEPNQLNFGVVYTFTASLVNVNGVARPIQSKTFTTYGGSYCMKGYSFPDFTINSKLYHVFSPHKIILATLTSETSVKVCESFGISIITTPVVGPTYQFDFVWTVSTMPSDRAEVARQSGFMNNMIDTTHIIFESNSLLANYNYTFTGVMKNNLVSGMPSSQMISTVACFSEFNLTGITCLLTSGLIYLTLKIKDRVYLMFAHQFQLMLPL